MPFLGVKQAEILSLSKLTAVPTRAGVETMFSTAGANRLVIELTSKGRPDEAIAFAEKWNLLVLRAADAISPSLLGLTGKEKEERFIEEMAGFIRSNYEMKGTAFLHEMVDQSFADCDTSATLAYDVGKKLGINIRLVCVYSVFGIDKTGEFKDLGSHVLPVTDNFLYETTNGNYYPISKLKDPDFYPDAKILEEGQIQFLTYIVLGIHFSENKNEDAAEKAYRNAIGLVPDIGFPYTLLAYVKFDQRDYAEAVKFHQEAIRKGGVTHYSHLGLAYTKLHDYKSALAAFEEALTSRQDLPDLVHYNIGLMYYDKQDYAHASKHFKLAFQIDPSDWYIKDRLVSSLFELGKLQFDKKQYKRALATFNEVLGINPYVPNVYSYRANIYDALGKHELAEKDRKTFAAFQRRL